jgi:hypothetical protein
MPAGRCPCGAVSFADEGPENWRAHRHCESRRRATSSPFTTFMGVANGRWRLTGAEPATYRSSPGIGRRFCATCGAQVAYRRDRWPNEIHFYAALLDDHADFAPQGHVHWAERVRWVETADRLPKNPGVG